MQDETLNQEQHVWFTQACAIFAISAIEVLMYDYAKAKTGSPESQKLNLNGFKRKYRSQTTFYDWLGNELRPDSAYQFLRTERNKIVHRGQPNKTTRGAGRWADTHFFVGLSSKPVGQVCQECCTFVDATLAAAKRNYPELH